MVFGAIQAALSGTAATVGSIAAFRQAKRKAEGAQGATPAQEGLLALSQENLSKMQARRGLSSRQVQNIQQIGQGQVAQAQSAVSAIQASQLSPLERQRLGERLLESQREQMGTIEQKIGMLDIGADIQRQEAVARASASAAAQAEQVRKAEVEKERLKDAYRAAGVKMATTILTNSATAASEFMPKPEEGPGQAPAAGAFESLREPTFSPQGSATGTPSLLNFNATDPLLARQLGVDPFAQGFQTDPFAATQAQATQFGVPGFATELEGADIDPIYTGGDLDDYFNDIDAMVGVGI
jgi:hypothetical protein